MGSRPIVSLIIALCYLTSGCGKDEPTPSGSSSVRESPDGRGWKREAFGELEFTMKGDLNVFEARFGGSQPGAGPQPSLGTRSVIPVLSILKDEVPRYPEALAVVRANGALYAVSEAGRAVSDLNSDLSPATVRQVRKVFAERALRAEQKIDEGMYEGIVVVFPTSCLPLRTAEAVKSTFQGLLVELILDKVKRLTGRPSDSEEARLHARVVSGAQKMLFFPEFPLYICEDADGSLDIVKAVHFMTDREAAQAAIEDAEHVALRHEGREGRVVSIEKLDGFGRITIHTSDGSVKYDVLATALKVGDTVQTGEMIGLIKNPKRGGR